MGGPLLQRTIRRNRRSIQFCARMSFCFSFHHLVQIAKANVGAVLVRACFSLSTREKGYTIDARS